MLGRTTRKYYRRSKAAVELDVYILSIKKMGGWKRAEKEHKEGMRAAGSAHHYILTAGCGGVFPGHPKEDILCSHMLLEENLIPEKEKSLPNNTGEGAGD